MTGAEWATLIPAIVGFLGAASAWLKSHQAVKTANRAESKADTALNGK